MNVYEFLNLVKQDPDKWKNYCEIIIMTSGKIELARPSHTEKIIDIYCEIESITRKEFAEEFPVNLSIIDFIVEKYSLISVWYNYIIRPTKINRFQQRTLQILIENGLINPDPEYKIAKEYTWYLNAVNRGEQIRVPGKNQALPGGKNPIYSLNNMIKLQ